MYSKFHRRLFNPPWEFGDHQFFRSIMRGAIIDFADVACMVERQVSVLRIRTCDYDMRHIPWYQHGMFERCEMLTIHSIQTLVSPCMFNLKIAWWKQGARMLHCCWHAAGVFSARACWQNGVCPHVFWRTRIGWSWPETTMQGWNWRSVVFYFLLDTVFSYSFTFLPPNIISYMYIFF